MNRHSKTMTMRQLGDKYNREKPFTPMAGGELRTVLGLVQVNSNLWARNRARCVLEGRKRLAEQDKVNQVADILAPTEGNC